MRITFSVTFESPYIPAREEMESICDCVNDAAAEKLHEINRKITVIREKVIKSGYTVEADSE